MKKKSEKHRAGDMDVGKPPIMLRDGDHIGVLVDATAEDDLQTESDKEAAEAFAAELESVPFADAVIPVLSNTDPTPETSGAALKARLRSQMITGVRWRETMERFGADGIDTAVEIGPGNVLSGLIKRGCEGVTTAQISGAADLGGEFVELGFVGGDDGEFLGAGVFGPAAADGAGRLAVSVDDLQRCLYRDRIPDLCNNTVANKHRLVGQ